MKAYKTMLISMFVIFSIGAAPKDLKGKQIKPVFKDATLILVDYQNEYLDGKLPLSKIKKATKEAKKTLNIARHFNLPVIHIFHDGKGYFERSKRGGKVISGLEPQKNEITILKKKTSSFAETTLKESLKTKKVIIIGLMSHMCLSSTIRAAEDLGYRVATIASTTTTRDLKGPDGKKVKAEQVTKGVLTSLGDGIAKVLKKPEDLLL